MEIITSCVFQGKEYFLGQLKNMQIIYRTLPKGLYQVKKQGGYYWEVLDEKEFKQLTDQPNFQVHEHYPENGKLVKPKALKGLKPFDKVIKKFKGQTVFSCQLFVKGNDFWVKDNIYKTIVDVVEKEETRHPKGVNSFTTKYYKVRAWVCYEGLGYIKEQNNHIVDFLNMVFKTYFDEKDSDQIVYFEYIKQIFEKYYNS